MAKADSLFCHGRGIEAILGKVRKYARASSSSSYRTSVLIGYTRYVFPELGCPDIPAATLRINHWTPLT